MRLALPFPHPGKRAVMRLLFGVGLTAALAWFALPFALPLPPYLLAEQRISPVILDRSGNVLRHAPALDGYRATPVSAEELPADLLACTLAAEDKRFFTHGGVDLLATGRATWNGIRHLRFHSGASTITQQLVKISRPPARRNIATKIRETLGARRLEMTWSKQEILTAYLNRLDYGNQRTGAAEAAAFYFQKPLAQLSLAESALLAGLPQGPSRLNPLRNPARALKRRDVVLNRLAAIGEIPAARIRAAIAEPLALRPLREARTAPWLAGLPSPRESSQPIRTTIDGALQRDVETIVSEEVARLRTANLRHAAVVVLRNDTREVLALATSADWNDPRGGQINGAFVPRSPGSTLKPFTYLLAIARGHRSPASIIADIPTPFRTPQGLDLPENYDRQYRGPVTLRTALACSLNIPAMRELNALGGPAPLHELLVSYGITTLDPDPARYGLGLTIGNAPVSLAELANAYATLARLGEHKAAVLFTGTPPPPPSRPAAIAPEPFLLIADVLADPAARAPSFTPGGPLDLPFRCAVKTGTSSDFRDNWCVGYTPDFTVGVWAGNFENKPMNHISGVAGAAPIFHRVMVRAQAGETPRWFTRPATLATVTIDSRNGKRIPPSLAPGHAREELVEANNPPPVAIAADYTEDGRAILDPAYAAWFASSHNQRRNEFTLADENVPSAEPLRVITPRPGMTLLLDPDIPSGSDKFRPVTNLPGTARWSSATLIIEPGNPEPCFHLTPGTHVLTATDPRNGATQDITVHVKKL